MLKRSFALVVACASCASAQDISVYADQSNYVVAPGESVTVDIMSSATGAAAYAVAGFWLDVIGNSNGSLAITNVTLNPYFVWGSGGGAQISGDDLIAQDGGQRYFPGFILPDDTSNPATLFSITYTADLSYTGTTTFNIERSTIDDYVNVGMSWYAETLNLYGDYTDEWLNSSPIFHDVDVDYEPFTIQAGSMMLVPSAPSAAVGMVAMGMFGARRRR